MLNPKPLLVENNTDVFFQILSVQSNFKRQHKVREDTYAFASRSPIKVGKISTLKGNFILIILSQIVKISAKKYFLRCISFPQRTVNPNRLTERASCVLIRIKSLGLKISDHFSNKYIHLWTQQLFKACHDWFLANIPINYTNCLCYLR